MSDNPLVADAQSTTSWFTGLGLVEDAIEVSNGIHDNSWVDATLGGLGGSLDALAMAIDPLGSLMAWGVGWLMEHVKPLKDALDWLAGNPPEIAAHAATWQNVSSAAADSHQRYADALRAQAAGWHGASGDAYRRHAAEQLAAIDGIATVTKAIGYAVEGAGLLVALVREIVRDLIAQFVATLAARLPQWLAAEGLTLGLATPVVVSQVAALVAKWVNRIQDFVRALLNSLRQLTGKLNELTVILNGLKQLLSKLGRGETTIGGPAAGAFPEAGLFRQGDGIVRKGRNILMTRDNVLAIAEKYGLDMSGVKFSLDKLRRGSGPGKEFYGVTLPSGEIKLARDAFTNEEQLARTLAHERFHLDELRDGMEFPWDEAARAASEIRAYAFEEQWWQSRKHLLDQE